MCVCGGEGVCGVWGCVCEREREREGEREREVCVGVCFGRGLCFFWYLPITFGA